MMSMSTTLACSVIFSRQSPCWMSIVYCSLGKSLYFISNSGSASSGLNFGNTKLWASQPLFQGILNSRGVESQERTNVVKSERVKPACSGRQDSSSIHSCEAQDLCVSLSLNPHVEILVPRPRCQRWDIGEMNMSWEQSPLELDLSIETKRDLSSFYLVRSQQHDSQ